MRRWNGWGDESVGSEPSEHALGLLVRLMGPGTPPTDASLESVVAGVPGSRLAADDAWSLDPEDRLRHARGQSLPDWIALRSGRIGVVPDAVARPVDTPAVRALLTRAAADDLVLVPWGGGTSVVGGVGAPAGPRPVVTVDLERVAGLRDLDATAGLATFGAGTPGPAVEAALGPHGLVLGHFPQSWEHSTIGGWVATRSSGQQSMGYGRIEALFAGGHLETPAGPLDLSPFPASAAGPDLRELVLGSEGRLGILTEVAVRASRTPDREIVRAYAVGDWGRALEAGRALAQAGLPLSMVRVSTPLETATTLALAASERSRRWLRRYLDWRGQGDAPCLLIVAVTGRAPVVRAAEGEVGRIVRGSRGVGVPGVGAAWRRERFAAPYLRNALWEAGYAVDTLETAAPWPDIARLAETLGPALRHALDDEDERVHAFSHLSHLYPTGSSLYVTYLFRIADDPDRTLDRWRRLKTVASEAVVAGGGTISHQHGIGRDHAPYLAAEKGPLGMAALRDVITRFDPGGRLSPGVLLEDAPR
jgi:alkyldihydroxyacetonephosphate synthase